MSYRRTDGQWLKTKIVATIGEEKRDICDDSGNEQKSVSYDQMFRWFVQKHSGCFMVDVIRLNMAFYTRDKNKEPYEKVFEWLEKEKKGLARDVGVLCDLAGAKTRLGEIQGKKLELKKGNTFRLCLIDDKPGTQEGASVLAYGDTLSRIRGFNSILEKLNRALEDHPKGIIVSIGDGKVMLRTTSRTTSGVLDCIVEKEGAITSGKGVTFEGIDLGLPSFEPPDEEALQFALDLDMGRGFLSFIGVSFVRGADVILNVRKSAERYLRKKFKYSPKQARLCCPDIIVKIETEDAIKSENLAAILDVADGVMIARGDLALQLKREDVPEKQKEIISLCNKRGKVVITATEMLASMEDNPNPVRAEVSDVFNAILDGTDAVMLSAETASGKYPAQAIDYMARIAAKAELYFEQKLYARKSHLNAQRLQELRHGSEALLDNTNERLRKAYQEHSKKRHRWEASLYDEKLRKSNEQGTTDRICEAGCELAEEEEFKAVLASTASGRTVRMISRFRPSVKVIGITYTEKCRRKLLLSYGACPVSIGSGLRSTRKPWKSPDKVFQKAALECVKRNLLQSKEPVVFISGVPLGQSGIGKVNTLQIKQVS